MDAYSKQQYYPIKKWLTGIRADLAKLMSSTLQKTLKKIGYKLDSSPQHISCEWIFGSDGAGYRKFHLKFVMVTVWKFQDFSVIQILREIKFGKSRGSNCVIFFKCMIFMNFCTF